MMQEDQIFNQFKSVLEHYQPEVPQSVYKGVRRKLWLSQFMRFNAASLNVWYVGVAICVGLGTWGVLSKEETATAQTAKSVSVHMESQSTIVQAASSSSSCEMGSEPVCNDLKVCKKSMSNARSLQSKQRQIVAVNEGPATEPTILDPIQEGPALEVAPADPTTQIADAVKVEFPAEATQPPATKKPRKRYAVDSFHK
jgi:hypothetical protein